MCRPASKWPDSGRQPCRKARAYAFGSAGWGICPSHCFGDVCSVHSKCHWKLAFLLGPYTDEIRMHKEPMILNLASSQPVALSTSFLTMVQVRRTSTGVHELVNATRDDDSQSERTSFILAVKARMRQCPFCPCPFLDQSFAALCAATTVPA